MGILRDAISSALGGNQLNNGLSGRPRLPFTTNNNDRQGWRSSAPSSTQSQYGQGNSDLVNRGDARYSPFENRPRTQCSDRNGNRYQTNQYPGHQDQSSIDRYSSERMQPGRENYGDDFSLPPPCYGVYANGGQEYYQSQPDGRPLCSEVNFANRGFSCTANFRPFALPQVAFGDGQPFLRGYSQELSRYSITMEDFIHALDRINLATIPSPENQIFQKGANIAGWFLPGAAGIGLTVGQIGVGLGAAAGHSSQLAKALSSANMNLFLPNGLEICIGNSDDVDAELGILPGKARPDSFSASPEERLACYGDLVSPLSQVLPPLQQSGRNDPIAMLGRGLSSRDSQKKMEKAQKKMQSGKSKDMDALEKGLKWIIVRQASSDALAYWQRNRR